MIDLANLERGILTLPPSDDRDALLALVRAVRAARAVSAGPFEDIVPAAQELQAALAAFTDSAEAGK